MAEVRFEYVGEARQGRHRCRDASGQLAHGGTALPYDVDNIKLTDYSVKNAPQKKTTPAAIKATFKLVKSIAKSYNGTPRDALAAAAVSYPHLTLPTKRDGHRTAAP